MSIEFPCPDCGSILRVPDEAAGKKAACPKCQMISAIPVAMSQPLSNPSFEKQYSEWKVDQFQESNNPFQTPQDLGREDMVAVPVYNGEIQPKRVRFGEVTSQTYKMFSKSIGSFLLLSLVFVLFMLSFIIPFMILPLVMDSGGPSPVFIVILMVLWYILALILPLGLMSYSLELVKNGRASMGTFMKGIRKFFPCLGYGIILWGINIALGIALFAIVAAITVLFLVVNQEFRPEVFFVQYGLTVYFIAYIPFCVLSFFVMFRTGWGFFAIMDRNVGVFEAFRISWRISHKNAFTGFLVFLVHYILLGMLTAFTCYIGGIIAFPYFWCLFAVYYLMMSGQYRHYHGVQQSEW